MVMCAVRPDPLGVQLFLAIQNLLEFLKGIRAIPTDRKDEEPLVDVVISSPHFRVHVAINLPFFKSKINLLRFAGNIDDLTQLKG